ncbi:MAG: tetratricopeptide repeat protein, partial [Candidatus Saccharibacteria bacterium]|nr:tetratricopeptide repeat protein [Moraxellaceae bacterium]
RPLSSPTVLAARTDSDQTSQLWQLTQQVQKLQDEVRNLRGKVESHDNDIDQLQKETKNRYVDFDQRLGQIQEELKKPQNETTQSVSTDSVKTTSSNSTSNTASTTTGNTTNNTSSPITGDESDKLAYIAAYEAYKAGGAAQAIAPMKKFITDYPKSPFVPNAYYWLGEFNLAITPPNFTAASTNFKLVMNQYPKTAKAAAATYRVATLADVDHHQATAITLMQSLVKNYPGTQEAGYAADYLKSHATTTAVDKTAVEKKTETKKTETTKVETSKVEKPVVKKVEKTEKTDVKKVEKVDSHKTEIRDKPKTKSIKKVKATDNVREDI